MTSPARRRALALLTLTSLAAAVGGVAGADGPGVADVAVTADVTLADSGPATIELPDQADALPTDPATIRPLDVDALARDREALVPREPAPVQRAARVATDPSWSVVASWYGPNFHGNRTANGETFDQWAMTAAHKTLPFGTVLEVTNPANGRSVTVRINDRGPFIAGRDLDLSRAAAEALGIGGVGTVVLREV